MKKEWISLRLGQFAPFSYGKSLPENYRNNSSKVPVYGSSGLVGFHTEALTDGPTIIIGRKGTVGALYYSPVPCWPIDTTFYISGYDKELIRYKYYLLKSLKLDQMNADSAVPGLNRDAAHSCAIYIPACEEEQKAIAHILGTLDDKIELNRRMNETLEQMARAIFKSWFVDFEPVRAKMSGRWKKGESLPGLPAHLWDLFPDRLVPSELGDIPEGWGIVRLGDVSDLNWGDTNVTKKSYVSNGYTAFSAKGPDGFLPYYDYDRTAIVLSAIGENSGLTWLAQGKWSCIKNTMRFWSIDESLPTEYLFYATCNKIFWPLRGSAQPFISQQDARNRLIMRPIGPLGKYFGNMVEPLHKKSFYVSTESKQLASLRDILLPRLISGKIHISTISNI